jgi:DsbC/DsbD-like thiol-disulfide interchange protein
MKPYVIVPLALFLLAGGLTAARADEKTYEIQKTAPRATVGVPALASVTVLGKNGWHVNEEAPVSVNVKAEPGVDLPKPKLVRADLAQASKQSVRFDIPFSAATPGKKTLTAETRFVMCQEQACKPVKETVAVEIDVGANPPPATATKPTKPVKSKSATP